MNDTYSRLYKRLSLDQKLQLAKHHEFAVCDQIEWMKQELEDEENE